MEGLCPDEKEAGRQKREREMSKENIQDANDGLANKARRDWTDTLSVAQLRCNQRA